MCTEKNRNFKLALMWVKVAQSPKKGVQIINLNFLYSGHSYLPNDADFGTIDHTIIEQHRKYKKFILHDTKQADFVPIKPIEVAILSRRKNINGEEVNCLKICWIRVLKGKLYTIFYQRFI